jgi:hypothetical protein
MGEVNFCSECGRINNYCVCHIEVEYLEESTEVFRGEYAFEGLTDPDTSMFKTILPKYE